MDSISNYIDDKVKEIIFSFDFNRENCNLPLNTVHLKTL